jgi:hypothetical protein
MLMAGDMLMAGNKLLIGQSVCFSGYEFGLADNCKVTFLTTGIIIPKLWCGKSPRPMTPLGRLVRRPTAALVLAQRMPWS